MAIRSITRGGGGAFKPQVVGLKELEAKLKKLKLDQPDIVQEMYGVVGEAAEEVRGRMKSAARAAGWSGQSMTPRKGQSGRKISGQDAIDSIFAFSQPRGDNSKRRRISALAGVGKRRTMIQWRAGKHPKSPRAKVQPGGLVAMSFATMLEFGTSNRAARPAIRVAIASAKSGIISKIADGYRNLIAKYAR